MVRVAGGWGRILSPADAPALDARTVAMARVAVAIARGDAGRLRDQLRLARHVGVPPLWIEELLLQSLLNVGYPLTLAAFAVWREVAGPAVDAGESLGHADWATWRRRGAETCAAVYRDTLPRLLLNLRALHPALEPLVIVDAYGKVLGRPGLDLKLRELCTLAAICTMDAPRQLRAHLRGARHVGWSVREIDEVLATVEPEIGTERALKVWEAWAEIRE
jgi:4-carboxymuconolactone decarboxylase